MQMGSEGASRIASQPDGFSCLHFLVGAYELFGEVPVNGFQPVVVAYNDIVAVSAGIIAYDAYFAVEGSADGITSIDLYVQSLVHTAEGRAVAIIAGDISAGGRHGKPTKVYLKTIGNFTG